MAMNESEAKQIVNEYTRIQDRARYVDTYIEEDFSVSEMRQDIEFLNKIKSIVDEIGRLSNSNSCFAEIAYDLDLQTVKDAIADVNDAISFREKYSQKQLSEAFDILDGY